MMRMLLGAKKSALIKISHGFFYPPILDQSLPQAFTYFLYRLSA